MPTIILHVRKMHRHVVNSSDQEDCADHFNEDVRRLSCLLIVDPDVTSILVIALDFGDGTYSPC